MQNTAQNTAECPNSATVDQTDPKGRPDIDIASLVKQDIEARAKLGMQRYGERLRPFNGRSPLIDAYQEVLDLAEQGL